MLPWLDPHSPPSPFPPLASALADPNGLLAAGGDLSPQRLTEQVWGQGFPQPTFSARFLVKNQRVVGEKHLKLKLVKQAPEVIQNSKIKIENLPFDAMLFFHDDPLPEIIDAVYRLEVNEFNGKTGLQLILIHWSASHD